jgi:hypothetical protein
MDIFFMFGLDIYMFVFLKISLQLIWKRSYQDEIGISPDIFLIGLKIKNLQKILKLTLLSRL